MGAGTLTGGEALAVADSLSASVLAGRSDVAGLAALTEALVHHPDSYASAAGIDALDDLAGLGLLDRTGRKGWQRFVTRLYAPQLTGYGFDPRAGAYAAEDIERTQRRAQIVAGLAGVGRDKALRRTLATATRAFLAGETGALDPAWLGQGLDIHLARGKLPAAKALVAQALASEDPVFRPAALAAVAGSGSKPIAAWALDGLKDPRLRAGEQRDLLRGVILTAATREIGYAWLHAHLDALTSGANGIFYAARLPQLLARFCSAERADQFARELRPRFAGKAGALELERTIERVRTCATLRERRGEAIAAAFARLR